MITRRGFMKLLWRMFLAGAALTGYATGIEAMGRPRVTRYQVTPHGWPEGLKLKITALADFHACEPWMSAGRIAAICDQANDLGGDIMLLLGDYEAGMPFVTGLVAPEKWAASISRLKAPLGVHAVLGNHDYLDDHAFQRDPWNGTSAERVLAAVGIPVYINQAILLEKDGHSFWLAGLGDQIVPKPVRLADGGQGWGSFDDLNGLLGRLSGEAPVILMAHEPDIFPDVPPRIGLTLSGHTHAGQVNLFGWRPVVPSRYGSRFAYGHFHEGGRDLIVTGGLGCTGLPVRLGAWPEILSIEVG
jgi:predicted MPP superfamily phosphohydrolase